MGIDQILRFFSPKDRVFFPLFIEASENLVRMSNLLLETVQESDLAKRNRLIKEIESAEHKGDDINHEITGQLNTVFITPFDREDIHYLSTSIDDIADRIKDAALRIKLYQPAKMPLSLIKMAELITEGTKLVRIAIIELSKLDDIDKLRETLFQINNIENQSDTIFELALTDLFANEKDPIELIKVKDIIAKIESASDKCEDIAHVIDSIIVKTT
jgi:predicted phosphate transport protein (TIGR00153 family)